MLPGRAGGFTLLELMLSLGLLVLLMSLAVGTWNGTLGATRTRENATRLSGMLRTARAEAALTGRRLRLTFEEGTGQPVVSIETDPLNAPGVYQPYDAWWVRQVSLSDDVYVWQCRLEEGGGGVEAEAFSPAQARTDDTALAMVTFYPDGSSDSVSILLASDDPDHPWMSEIKLNGMDGTITVRELSAEERDEVTGGR